MFCKLHSILAGFHCEFHRAKVSYDTGCLEQKFTQEILDKIRSFSCTRLIVTRAHRKVGRSVWWRFHSNRLTLLALAELWKQCVKIAYFCTPEDCYGKVITCLSPLQKIECTCFNFAVSIDIRICNLAWTVVQTGRSYTTPHCSDASVEWPPPALRAPPISRKLHCGVECSPHSPDPSPLDFFLRVMLRLKRTYVREPLTVIEFKIAIARESPRSPPIKSLPPFSGSLPALPGFRRFYTQIFKRSLCFQGLGKLSQNLAEVLGFQTLLPTLRHTQAIVRSWVSHGSCGFYSQFIEVNWVSRVPVVGTIYLVTWKIVQDTNHEVPDLGLSEPSCHLTNTFLEPWHQVMVNSAPCKLQRNSFEENR